MPGTAKITIYCSTISSAEVLPSQIKNGGTFEDFMADYEGAVVPQDADPNIMKLSGQLRDLPYKKGNSDQRRLSTPDAIILAVSRLQRFIHSMAAGRRIWTVTNLYPSWDTKRGVMISLLSNK